MMTSGSNFNEAVFRRQVESALAVVRRILDTTRNPRYAADEDHEYDDKFGLAEFLANTAVAAQMNVLEGMGLDAAKLADLHGAEAGGRAVTLRFEAEVTCDFQREEIVEAGGDKTEFVAEIEETKESVEDKITEKKTLRHHVVTKVTEYHWVVGLQYAIYCYAGSDPEAGTVVLQRRTSSAEIVTRGNKESPIPSKARSTPVDVPLNWILGIVSAQDGTCQFKINRTKETCKTPRQNDDVNDAIAFFDGMKRWSDEVRTCFVRDVEGKIFSGLGAARQPISEDPKSKFSLKMINEDELFVPVIPLFEKRDPKELRDEGKESALASPGFGRLASYARSGDASSPLLPISDINLFLKEQRRSLEKKVGSITQFFPSKDTQTMISGAEAILVLISLHAASIAKSFSDGVDYIENMLRDQLIRAIGKEVQESDFEEFVRFHDKKLLKQEYAPEPFCYAIRRQGHYPDGVLSIEEEGGSSREENASKSEPIVTITRKLSSAAPMTFPINAATTIEFGGDRYVHAWVLHCFAGFPGLNMDRFRLVARARQFSSFLLLVGKISGPDSFQPQDAILLRDKDEVFIPLLLNQLPTPKEFKDAISSLSPEQQRFATAFREMQLESSVFAICCIQLKPQLEALLGLPGEALTKEIGLTRDLLSLFIEYQIPSDLLSFDGCPNMTISEKVGVVKEHVGAVLKVIESAKAKDLEAAQKEADMAFEMKQVREAESRHRAAYRGAAFGGVAAAPAGGGLFGAGAPAPLMMRSSAQMAMAQPAVAACAPPPTYARFEAELSNAACLEIAPDAVEFDGDSAVHSSTDNSKHLGSEDWSASATDNSVVLDFTRLPKALDSQFDKLDDEDALCTTVIKTKNRWTKKSQKNLLAKFEERVLGKKECRTEREKAFDLLDALSRSGSLPVNHAELHVMVAATHNFSKSVMDTVIKENVNPIEKMEKSTLIVASTIHGTHPARMLKDEAQVSRVEKYSPALFGPRH